MILVLNCGSQSIKWKVFDEKLKLVKKNTAEVLNSADYQGILEQELRKLSGSDISVIGHRVVHGGKIFVKPEKITEVNLSELEKLTGLAPLHNSFNILGIKACQKIFPGAAQIAVFDTEFFSDLSEKAFTYALPEKIIEDFGFRKYGFHGISHEYATKIAMKKLSALGGPASGGKIITCHLGGGASIAAIKNGKAIDTSMGFTPLEGLVMMTRSGNIDAGIVLELAREFGADKASEILNKESGIKGICGEGEMLNVLDKIKSGDKKAKFAMDVFVYSIQKYIGAYYAILGGCDALVFTGSIGSGLKITRDLICKDLSILKMPTAKPSSMRDGKAIGTKVLAIETNEELAIAEKIIKLI